MSKKQERRDYDLSDPDMYEAAKTKRGFFVEDKVDFVAFDVDFDDPFATDMQTAIDDAENFPDDETLDDQLTQLSTTTEEEMEKSRRKFQDSKFFIEKTFPDDEQIRNEFGYNDYKKSRDTQQKMIKFMNKFHKVAEKYKLDLIANGYSQLMIDEIETRRAALDAANIAQELFKGALPKQTQLRIKTNNTAWAFVKKVCTAGKTIYYNDYAQFQRYLLPPGEENPDVINIKGIITDTTLPTGLPLDDVLVEVLTTGISIHSIATGRFEIGGLPDGTYDLLFSKTGFVSQTISVTITSGHAPDMAVALQQI